MILGLVGSGSLLLSLMTDAYSVQTVLGNITISMSKYMSGLIILVFLIAGCSVAFSLLKLAVPQIVTGSFTTLLAAFIFWHIKSKESSGGTSLTVYFGVGAYLFFLAASLVLASGIIYAVATKKAKAAGIVDAGEAKRKKIGRIICICLGALVVLCIGLFLASAIKERKEKNMAKDTVTTFMNAALSYDVDTMNKCLSTDVKDKNGLMEAYDPDIMSNAFLSIIGATKDELGEDGQKCLRDTSVYFGQSYLKKYSIGDVAKNDDGSYTIKVPATIINMDNTDDTIKEKSSEAVEKFAEENREELLAVYLNYPAEEVTLRLMDMLMPDICNILNEAISESDEQETEFTIVVKKIDGEFMITEIDYKD